MIKLAIAKAANPSGELPHMEIYKKYLYKTKSPSDTVCPKTFV